MNKFFIVFAIIILVVLAGVIWWGYGFINQPQSQDALNVGGNNNVTGAVLDLSNKNLDKIPQNVFSQTQLEVLDVSNNNLTGAIQAEIRNLQNLKVLRAANNKMTGVPAEIGQLQKLEVLDLSNNQLTGLPQEMGNLKNLKLLDLSGNNYSKQDLDYIKARLPAETEIITE